MGLLYVFTGPWGTPLTSGQEISYLLRNLKVHYNVHAPATGSCPKPNNQHPLTLSSGYNLVQRKIAVLRQQYAALIYDLWDKWKSFKVRTHGEPPQSSHHILRA